MSDTGQFIPTTPQIKVSTEVIFKAPDIFGEVDMGKNFTRYEYEAHINQPEIVRVTVLDPHSTIFDEHMSNYFTQAVPIPPIMMMTQGRWSPAHSGRKLELTKKEHALMSIENIGPGEGSADQSYIVFTGMSTPHYILAAGDAGGYAYEGRISDVIPQVCDRYSRGLFSTRFRSQTKDDQHNKWWQNRMHPLAFVKSLLRWSTPLTKYKTRWIFWADTDKDEPSRLEFFEQRDDPSIHRSTYWWGADPSRAGHGDILGYEMIGDNAHDTRSGKIVTSGISTLSGAYHDRIVHSENKDVVYIDENSTNKKYVQRSKPKEGYTLPDTNEPLKEGVGWTRAHSLPELSAGEMGLKYEDYIDGYARGEYYRGAKNLQRAKFKILGHHIWSESIGLGYDTINIMWRTQKMKPHFMHGVWIVDGFKHIITSSGWETILYCHRLHHNAKGKKIGIRKEVTA
jgi:hypothetical protein